MYGREQIENNEKAITSSVQSLRASAIDSGRSRRPIGLRNLRLTYMVVWTLRLSSPTPSFSHLKLRPESNRHNQCHTVRTPKT